MNSSKFQTIVDIPKFNWETGYGGKNIFLGSCFAENIGNKMFGLKYETDINPFGILYNPKSLASGINLLLNEKEFTPNDLISHDGLWHSFSHHGRFSFTDKNKTLFEINSRIKTSSEFLKNANFLFITFGTAWVYRYLETGQIVSNCHKIPSKKFERVRLSVEEITEEYHQLLQKIWKTNPNIKIVFTVSPIRHWKDGAIENQLSKSTLLLAINNIVKSFGETKCAYFPSYEIVVDELRDYRFYSDDMIHLTDFSIQHIWDIFNQSLVDEKSRKTAIHIQKLKNAVNHKPFNKNSNEHLNFAKMQLRKVENLETKYPNLNFKLEKEYFFCQINEFKNINK